MKAIFFLIFLSVGSYTEQSSYKEMYRKTINELVDQLPEIKQFKEELKKAEGEVLKTKRELREAEREVDRTSEEELQADNNYYFKLKRLIQQSSEGLDLKLKRDRVRYEDNDANFAYNKAKEELMGQFPISRQFFEAEEKVDEARREEGRLERGYYDILSKLIEQSMEMKYLHNEYNQAGYEYHKALETLIKQPLKGITEQSMEMRYLRGEYGHIVHTSYISPRDPEELMEKSPEGEKFLAEQFPEVWGLREGWYKKAVGEYDKALEELIEQNPTAQVLREEWNKVQEILDEAKEERGRVRREYHSTLEELIEKSPEVKGLRDKKEKAEGEYNQVNEEYNEFGNKLAEQSPEVQGLREVWDQAQEEAAKAREAEDKAEFEYRRAIYEYNKSEYKYHKVLEALVEQSPEVQHLREKVMNQKAGVPE